MLGDTITMTLGGSGGTAKVLNKINQDSYSAEYLLKETLGEYRLRIRHLNETVKAGKSPVERHELTFTETVYPTEAVPNGYIREAKFTFRCNTGDAAASAVDVGEAVSFYCNGTILTALHGWES